MRKIISFVLIIVSVFSFTFSLVSCNPERNETYRKKITTRDVLQDKYSNSLYLSFVVRPQIDIDDLKIVIGFYDKNGYPVGHGYKKIGKVIAGQEYHIEFDDNYFSYKQLLAVSKYKYLNAEGSITVDQNTHGFCSNHNYDEGYENKKSTCDCLGEKIYTCKSCGYKKSEMIPRIEHNWVDNKYGDMKYICTKCCIQADGKYQ